MAGRRGKNQSAPTVLNDRTDIGQFIAWLREVNIIISAADERLCELNT